jgi:hypothetical protein
MTLIAKITNDDVALTHMSAPTRDLYPAKEMICPQTLLRCPGVISTGRVNLISDRLRVVCCHLCGAGERAGAESEASN